MSGLRFSPADVLRAALIAGGAGDDPSALSGTSWPIFVDHLPQVPTKALCVYNTAGITEGRIMRTGETIRKPGWQIRVRAADLQTVRERVALIQKYLDTICQFPIAIDGELYFIVAVSQTGDALDLGQEPDAARRNNVTLNGTITLS